MAAIRKEIGLAIVGCGTIGRIRAIIAHDYPGVGWLGLSDINEPRRRETQGDSGRTSSPPISRELIARPEVDAVIIATDEQNHVEPTIDGGRARARAVHREAAGDRRPPSRLAILAAIENASVDAVLGYTQRFRRRFLAVKERLVTGQIGDVHSVVTRAFMNRMVPIATVRRTQDRRHLTPMVVSGTHSLDMSLWLMGGSRRGRSMPGRPTRCWVELGHQGLDLRHLHHGRRRHLLDEHLLGAARGLARLGLRARDRHRRHQGGDRHRGHPPRPGHGDQVAQGGGYVPDGFIRRRGTSTSSPPTLPATCTGAALGADARGDR